MDYIKEKIVEMTGTDIAEHGNWIKDLDSKNDFMGADTFWLSESASRIGKTSDTNEDYTEVVGAFLLENGFIEKDNCTGVKQITKKAPYQAHTKFSPAAFYLSLHLDEKFGIIVESEILPTRPPTLSNSETNLNAPLVVILFKTSLSAFVSTLLTLPIKPPKFLSMFSLIVIA